MGEGLPGQARTPPMRYRLIELSDEGVAEMDGARRAVFLPRAEVRSIALRHGFTAERQLPMLLLAAALVAVAAYACLFSLALIGGGSGATSMMAVPVLLVPIAAYVAFLALRRGYFLEVHTTRERRKLAVGVGAARVELEGFLAQAKERMGWEVTGPA
jgi:hypothetical protein